MTNVHSFQCAGKGKMNGYLLFDGGNGFLYINKKREFKCTFAYFDLLTTKLHVFHID